MKFQCGTCGKYYLIEHAEQISTKQMLRCIGCGNIFVLQKDVNFSSSSRNSKLVCDRCGSLIKETEQICSVCSAACNIVREELRIDNREYAPFVVRRGKIQPRQGRKGRGGKAVLLAGAVLLASTVLLLFLPGDKRDALKRAFLKPLGIKSTTETDVVILRSGTALYAEKIEHQGASVKITEKNGEVLTVDEDDVAYAAKAVLEE